MYLMAAWNRRSDIYNGSLSFRLGNYIVACFNVATSVYVSCPAILIPALRIRNDGLLQAIIFPYHVDQASPILVPAQTKNVLDPLPKLIAYVEQNLSEAWRLDFGGQLRCSGAYTVRSPQKISALEYALYVT